ncbi:hypothetical protein BLNAU_11505 [Blattamonas nauphoetae]|uniref:Uncharacterized protein n=1 Tax=Blattamonas nauphoetae TaxID=2049346 RepID=A0ABQ9XQK8_9EUKA|nr:hypothetical protein BLNAU_11505 [Blattamonas nauphoetae]
MQLNDETHQLTCISFNHLGTYTSVATPSNVALYSISPEKDPLLSSSIPLSNVISTQHLFETPISVSLLRVSTKETLYADQDGPRALLHQDREMERIFYDLLLTNITTQQNYPRWRFEDEVVDVKCNQKHFVVFFRSYFLVFDFAKECPVVLFELPAELLSASNTDLTAFNQKPFRSETTCPVSSVAFPVSNSSGHVCVQNLSDAFLSSFLSLIDPSAVTTDTWVDTFELERQSRLGQTLGTGETTVKRIDRSKIPSILVNENEPHNEQDRWIFRAHNSPIRILRFSRDGSLLATGSDKVSLLPSERCPVFFASFPLQGTTIRIFSPSRHCQRYELHRSSVGRQARLSSFAFSSSNKLFAVSSNTPTVHLFSLLSPPQKTWFGKIWGNTNKFLSTVTGNSAPKPSSDLTPEQKQAQDTPETPVAMEHAATIRLKTDPDGKVPETLLSFVDEKGHDDHHHLFIATSSPELLSYDIIVDKTLKVTELGERSLLSSQYS